MLIVLAIRILTGLAVLTRNPAHRGLTLATVADATRNFVIHSKKKGMNNVQSRYLLLQLADTHRYGPKSGHRQPPAREQSERGPNTRRVCGGGEPRLYRPLAFGPVRDPDSHAIP
ncbi:hypothetical protein QFZ34_001355 [Phyllobacterium ifriqiyense]|uniref:Secreted protein n=1 Tax=Phyllobacterium ifriqiyense TaxID=314238 RepID=A0ABU0S5Y9_9HYPH|nr:hypothetical protein [Phyllobacterium ifriqiyense]MDQ0996178.1 hypothetical protein [Phyllobacterium ifriqiyense]